MRASPAGWHCSTGTPSPCSPPRWTGRSATRSRPRSDASVGGVDAALGAPGARHPRAGRRSRSDQAGERGGRGVRRSGRRAARPAVPNSNFRAEAPTSHATPPLARHGCPRERASGRRGRHRRREPPRTRSRARTPPRPWSPVHAGPANGSQSRRRARRPDRARPVRRFGCRAHGRDRLRHPTERGRRGLARHRPPRNAGSVSWQPGATRSPPRSPRRHPAATGAVPSTWSGASWWYPLAGTPSWHRRRGRCRRRAARDHRRRGDQRFGRLARRRPRGRRCRGAGVLLPAEVAGRTCSTTSPSSRRSARRRNSTSGSGRSRRRRGRARVDGTASRARASLAPSPTARRREALRAFLESISLTGIPQPLRVPRVRGRSPIRPRPRRDDPRVADASADPGRSSYVRSDDAGPDRGDRGRPEPRGARSPSERRAPAHQPDRGDDRLLGPRTTRATRWSRRTTTAPRSGSVGAGHAAPPVSAPAASTEPRSGVAAPRATPAARHEQRMVGAAAGDRRPRLTRRSPCNCPHGDRRSTFTIEPVSLAGGRLRALDRSADIERTLPLAIIVEVRIAG